ncbi:hypothetical protein [Streptomyces mirabilis]|uniref:hypothetical protein n=1 Tax=Streptomyces mirabilis TaxID=68239 RepID=UPI0036A6FD03
MKVYKFHPCADRHTSWPSLAACIWSHATVDGDGPFAAASCGARAITLYADPGQAQARKRGYDRDGCRPKCHRHHNVIAIAPAAQTSKPPKPVATVTPCATTPAVPPLPKPVQPICGRPRANGQRCHRPAGWGADPGQPWCRDHGGSTVERRAEKERLVEQALTFARLSEKARTAPLTAEEQVQAEAAAQAVFRSRRVRQSASLKRLPGWPSGTPLLEVPELSAGLLGLLGLLVVDGGL